MASGDITNEVIEEAEERTYVVPPELSGLRIDQAATRLADGLSRAALQRLIDTGLCTLNGRFPKAADRVAAGDVIALTLLPPAPPDVQPEDIPLTVVYEDAHLVVVNKPRGMVVHPAAGNPRGTLVNALLAHCGDLSGIGGELRPGIVHRLDKDTTGLIVVAKSDLAHRALASQIANRIARRTYWALVWGTPSLLQGRVCAPIGRHPRDRQKMAIVTGGREAVTRYVVREVFPISSRGKASSLSIALLELELETGRTHQIRVHMAHVGHPVVGDSTYGKQRSLPQSASEELRQAVAQLSGQALHAKRLSFVHPVSGERMEFDTEVPADFANVLAALRNRQG